MDFQSQFARSLSEQCNLDRLCEQQEEEQHEAEIPRHVLELASSRSRQSSLGAAPRAIPNHCLQGAASLHSGSLDCLLTRQKADLWPPGGVSFPDSAFQPSLPRLSSSQSFLPSNRSSSMSGLRLQEVERRLTLENRQLRKQLENFKGSQGIGAMARYEELEVQVARVQKQVEKIKRYKNIHYHSTAQLANFLSAFASQLSQAMAEEDTMEDNSSDEDRRMSLSSNGSVSTDPSLSLGATASDLAMMKARMSRSKGSQYSGSVVSGSLDTRRQTKIARNGGVEIDRSRSFAGTGSARRGIVTEEALVVAKEHDLGVIAEEEAREEQVGHWVFGAEAQPQNHDDNEKTSNTEKKSKGKIKKFFKAIKDIFCRRNTNKDDLSKHHREKSVSKLSKNEAFSGEIETFGTGSARIDGRNLPHTSQPNSRGHHYVSTIHIPSV